MLRGRWFSGRAAATLALVVIAAACGSGGDVGPREAGPEERADQLEPAAPSAIDGDYYGGTSVLRLDAGTWTFVSGKSIRSAGVASVGEGELTISEEAGCPDAGTYAWTLAKETLTLEAIEESCPGRSVLLSKEWRVILPLETVNGNTPEGTLVTLPDLRFTGYWGELDVSGQTSGEIEVFIREGYHEGGWAFSPTVLVGEPGQRLDLTVRNPVGKGIFRTEHNFTLEEQQISVDLPPGDETVVAVAFPDSGFLTFFCRRHVDEGQAGALTVG